MSNNTIVLPNAPGMPGLSFRAIRGEQDAEALYAIHAGRMAHDQIDPLSSFEDVPSREGLSASLSRAVAEGRQDQWLVAQVEEQFDIAAYVAELNAPKHDPTLWQVAWEGDQVAGQVLSIVENGRAEVLEVSVRPAWRRRGLARALLSRALRRLRGRGIDVIRIGTVSEFRTRARDLYASVGFRVVKEFPRYRKLVT